MDTVGQAGEMVKGGGMYVAWVDTPVVGILHSCIIAMHADRGALEGRIARWRRSDRWVCGKRFARTHTREALCGGCAHVEVSAVPEYPCAPWSDTWSREIDYRNALHDLYDWQGMPLDAVELARRWGSALGLRDVCMQRLWAKHDLQCGVGQ